MGRKSEVDYDSLNIICNGSPCKESIKKYYDLLIEYNAQRFGKETTKQSLEEILSEEQ